MHGSGKSISMCCYAGKLLQQPEMNNPTLVVVTDRNDLDGQLYQQFCSAKDLLKQTPEQAESREQLREMLASRKSGGIIFTTIQKFSLEGAEDDHPVLCERTNVVVISAGAEAGGGIRGGLHRDRGGAEERAEEILYQGTKAGDKGCGDHWLKPVPHHHSAYANRSCRTCARSP